MLFKIIHMADHYRWYPSNEQRTVPWNARYEFPSQANKAIKSTPRIPPKNGATFTQGNTIRLEFPAQGYVNPKNFTVEFDVTLALTGPSEAAQSALYIQNNIHSIFTRIRLMYGATPLEDLINSGFLVRQLTEWTNSNGSYADQTSVAQGIGGVQNWQNSTATQGTLINTRKYNHGIVRAYTTDTSITPPSTTTLTTRVFPSGVGGAVSSTPFYATRRYQIQFPLGLFNQGKLIPVKFMASQLAIELTLATKEACLILNPVTNFKDNTAVTKEGGTPSYNVTNVNMIPEILEFDASYDAMFLEGLQKGGVPIQFSSWHNFTFQQGGGTLNNLIIQEKSRSLKAIFAMIKLQSDSITNDTGATFAGLGSTIDSYQFRIGGRFFPASPVVCSGWETTTGAHNGACEAFIELQKCLNTLGDARLSTAICADRWAMPLIKADPTGMSRKPGLTGAYYNDGTYGPYFLNTADGLYGYDYTSKTDNGEYTTVKQAYNGYSTPTLSSIFCMSTCLESTSGREISGLNAEEQADISLLIKFNTINTGVNSAASTTTTIPFNIEVFTYYDAMLVLRENNVLELIQ